VPDLDAAIRATLDSHELVIKGADNGVLRVLGEADQWKAALIAVLDLHPVEAHECPQQDDRTGERYTAYEPTCPTRRAIAKELGVEAP
jgi:hypothetical protein